MIFKEILERLEQDDQAPILEASFSEGKLKKVSKLLASILGHTFGEFKLLGGSLGEQEFKKPGLGEGKGFAFMNNRGQMVRFGWLKKAKKSKYQINIVDWWDPKDSQMTWDKPTMTIKIEDWLNVVDVVNQLKDILINGEVALNALGESLEEVNEIDYPSKKLQAYGEYKGLPWDGKTSDYKYRNQLKEAGLWDDEEYKGFKVSKHQKETNSVTDTFAKAEKRLKETKWADPDLVFDDIEKLTRIVALGGANALVIAGAAGLGKCTTAETDIPVFGL